MLAGMHGVTTIDAHYGDHEGMMTRAFGRTVVADLIRASLGEEVELPTTRPIAPPAPTSRPTTRPLPTEQRRL